MKQLIFNLPESTSRTQTHVVTIPRLKEIVSNIVNTGNVTIKNIDLEKEEVTLELRNGSYHRSELAGGSYTPSDSKYVSLYPGYIETAKSWYVKQGSAWVYLRGEYIRAPSTYSYNSGGYSGTLSQTGNYITTFSRDNPLPPSTDGYPEGQWYVTQWREYSQEYGGTVTRPASDTRWWRYYYKYVVTINYDEKGFNLQVKKDGSLKPANQGWVKTGGALRPIEKIQTKKDGVLREV